MEQLIEQEEDRVIGEMDMAYEEARAEAIELESLYLATKNVMDTYKQQMEEAKARILQLAAQGIEFDLITISHGERKGAVDMKVLQRKFDLMDGDIDACRKEKVSYDTIRIKK